MTQNAPTAFPGAMTDAEKLLLSMLLMTPSATARAVLLENYIAEMGPLSEEAGAKVRELLEREPMTQNAPTASPEELRAEIDRLRAALHQILNGVTDPHDRLVQVLTIARAALEPKP